MQIGTHCNLLPVVATLEVVDRNESNQSKVKEVWFAMSQKIKWKKVQRRNSMHYYSFDFTQEFNY